ncbi:emerin [Mantella aurantiaca]
MHVKQMRSHGSAENPERPQEEQGKYRIRERRLARARQTFSFYETRSHAHSCPTSALSYHATRATPHGSTTCFETQSHALHAPARPISASRREATPSCSAPQGSPNLSFIEIRSHAPSLRPCSAPQGSPNLRFIKTRSYALLPRPSGLAQHQLQRDTKPRPPPLLFRPSGLAHPQLLRDAKPRLPSCSASPRCSLSYYELRTRPRAPSNHTERHQILPSMDKIKHMSNEELKSLLLEYGFQPGPIVESTRTLYEKKLVEYERKKKTFPASSGSYESRQQYSTREYDDNQDDYETYEEETYTKKYYPQQAHQRIKEDLRNNSRMGENAYQNVSQVRQQSSYSQGVEARRPIRPKAKEDPKQPSRRFLPLWLQLLLLLLFAGSLVYLYFRQTDQDPFKFLQETLRQSGQDAAHAAD